MSLVQLDDVRLTFEQHGSRVHAVNGVTFAIGKGETFGLIGESGSGKSTIGRIASRLLTPASGRVLFEGRDLADYSAKGMRAVRSRIQTVFQEPYEQLDPKMTVGEIVREPLEIHERSTSGAAKAKRVAETLELVGLSLRFAPRYPRELSGGQQQRVGIARAVITHPSFIILDEPTSSLDLSVRAQILGLLADLQHELNLAYLFISHDIHTVEYLCDRIAVLYLGKILEVGPTASIFNNPRHPYTQALLSAKLSPNPRERPARLLLLENAARRDPSSDGCVLYGRCPIGLSECTKGAIPLVDVPAQPGVECACIRLEVSAGTSH